MGNGSGRRCMRAGALAGFIGIHAALDAPLDGQPQQRTKASVSAHGTAQDQTQHVWQALNVQGDDHAGHDDVAQRHERHDDFGKAGNALHAAKDDKAQQHGQNRRRGFRGHAQRGVQAAGDAVGLHARQQHAAGNNGADGKYPGVPLHAQAFFDVKRRAAAILAVEFFLVDLAQGGFDKRRAGPQKRHHPHPEHRAGTAKGDSSGHAGDIASAYPASQGHGQRLKRRYPGIAALAVKHQPDHFAEMAHLSKTGTHRKYSPTPSTDRSAPGSRSVH